MKRIVKLTVFFFFYKTLRGNVEVNWGLSKGRGEGGGEEFNLLQLLYARRMRCVIKLVTRCNV